MIKIDVFKKGIKKFRAESKIRRELLKEFGKTERGVMVQRMLAMCGALIIGSLTTGLVITCRFSFSLGYIIFLSFLGVLGVVVTTLMYNNGFICWLLENEVEK